MMSLVIIQSNKLMPAFKDEHEDGWSPSEGSIILSTCGSRGTRWRSWLKHCATSQKVAGLIPDGVIGIFH